MTAVIRRCPFYDIATQVEVAGEKVDIRPYQIILWVSLRSGVSLSRRFPAILDTGHSLNFSITERQLRDWGGINPGSLKEIGRSTLNNRAVFLSRADLSLHRNRTGCGDELAGTAATTEFGRGHRRTWAERSAESSDSAAWPPRVGSQSAEGLYRWAELGCFDQAWTFLKVW